MIDQPTIDRILDAANIVDVVSEFVTLRKRGINYVGLCPFHSDKSPSFYVSPSKNICKCFACGEGGTAVHFIMKHEQLSYFDALRFLAKKYNIEIQERELTEKEKQIRSDRESMLIVNSWAGQYFSTLLHEHVEGKSVGMRYFAERGLREDIIRKFQLGYSLDQRDALYKTAIKAGYKKEFLEKTGLVITYDNGNVNDRFRGRVIFPVHTLSGKVVAFGGRVLKKDEKTAKYVNSPESEIYHKSNELYGIYFAKQAIMKQDRCFLVEGYMDVIAINQAGFSNVVATLGTAITPEHARKLSRFAKEVVIAYDSDGPGQQATQKAINRLSEVGIATRILHMTGAKDPDEYIKKYGSERFRLLLENAGDAINFRLDRCKEGLDPDTEAGKVQLLKRVVSVLAEIQNPLEREVYLSRTANKWEISAEVLHQQVERTIRSKKKLASTQAWKDIIEHTVRPEPQQPQSAIPLREYKAEERILCYVLNRPDESAWVIEQIQPDAFPTPLYRQVLEAFADSVKRQTGFSLSAMGDVLSDSEMGKLSGISARNQEIPVTAEEVKDCIRTLKNDMPSAIETDEDLLKLIQKKQHPDG